MKLKLAAVALLPMAAVLMLNARVQAQPPSKSIWDGIYTEEQATARQGHVFAGMRVVPRR